MEQLSKKKYIHHLYVSGDLTLHHEKYPVVYSNSKYVYWKKPGDPELRKTYTSNIGKKTYDECLRSVRIVGQRIWFNEYLWDISDEDLQKIKDNLKNSCQAEKVAQKLIDLKRMEENSKRCAEMANIIKKELYDMGVTNHDQS